MAAVLAGRVIKFVVLTLYHYRKLHYTFGQIVFYWVQSIKKLLSFEFYLQWNMGGNAPPKTIQLTF